MGGLIGKLLSFVRVVRNGANLSDVKTDVGGGDVLTATHSQGSGIDSVPLPGDYPITIKIPRSGGIVTVGFVETDAQQKAGAGDTRFYARGADRLETIEFWLKADGTGLLSNSNGQFELRPDGSIRGQNANGHYELLANGTIDLNGVTIDTDGNINTAGNIDGADIEASGELAAPSVKAAGKELAGHKHNILSGSSAPGPTGANN